MKQYYRIIIFFFLCNTSFSQNNINLKNSFTIDSSINSNKYENVDVRLFRFIYNDSSAFKDALSRNIDNSVMPMAILMPISLFSYGRIYNKTFDENTGYLLTVSEAVTLGFTFGIKEIVKRKRPYARLSNVQQKDNSTSDPYSFPSGHTSTTFSIATMFALRYPKYPQAYVPMYLWSLIAAYGRPYLGMHYPSDLLAGAVIGAGSSVLIYSLRKELFNFKNNILKESKSDEGSINGGVISLFAGSFLVTEFIDNFIFKSSRINIEPNQSGNGFRLNLNY